MRLLHLRYYLMVLRLISLVPCTGDRLWSIQINNHRLHPCGCEHPQGLDWWQTSDRHLRRNSDQDCYSSPSRPLLATSPKLSARFFVGPHQ
ncbi:hypothetical protein ACHAXS_001733 [Conticribra weissflogii]